MNREQLDQASLLRYNEAAEASARQVIAFYSTSFGLASKLLRQPMRNQIQNIYALVRVADEIVDGAAAGALGAKSTFAAGTELDKLETETYNAMNIGFSTNLVVHAFAITAREVGIGKDLVEPFFYSMRLDLQQTKHDQKSFDKYVYGSAEVVGLMCLQTFIHGRETDLVTQEKLVKGARALGAAFQKVNFLRDLAADFEQLGRSYFPNVKVENFDEATKNALVADVNSDLETSAQALPLLPRSARTAVLAAQLLFTKLNNKIAATPAEELIKTRIRVGNPTKLILLLRALLGVMPK